MGCSQNVKNEMCFGVSNKEKLRNLYSKEGICSFLHTFIHSFTHSVILYKAPILLQPLVWVLGLQ